MPLPTPLQPNARASQPQAGDAQLLARQSPAGHWPGGRQWDLTTLYSLTALMDFGLDPNSKQAHKMIDRIEKRLVFKPLNNRPYLRGETEPCINGRILGIGAYFKKPIDALAKQLLSEQLEDGGWNCKRGPPYLRNARPAAALPSTPPFACSKDCSSTNAQAANRRPSPKPASVLKIICSSAACSAHSAPAKSSTIAGAALSPSPPFGTTTSCAASITCAAQESNPTAAFEKPSKSSSSAATRTAAGRSTFSTPNIFQ